MPHAADQRGITGTPLPMHLGRAQRMGIALHEGEGHHRRRGRAQAAHHQGCAMVVLARIESVNMYWYVWVCILACIFVRIGMYQLGTY